MLISYRLIVLSIIFIANSASALTVSTGAAVSNNYMVIENQVDNELFITSSSLDPRFSGANTWTKLDSSQVSLAYLGYVGWTSNTNYYNDMWISDSPINGPFVGIRCATGANCPSSGYISADISDSSGFYKATPTGLGITGGAYGFGSLSEEAMSFFSEQATGSVTSLNVNFCRTTVNYDAKAGERCADQTSGNWYQRTFNLTKRAHLQLTNTNALEELWIASDGTPSISKEGGMCEVGIVANVDGVICKMVDYKLEQSASLSNSLRMRMYLDTSLLGFTPAATAIKYSGNGSNWYNWSALTSYTNLFSVGDGYIYMFLSKNFLKGLVDNEVSISGISAFTFGFYNSVSPESGYYQFTPSLSLNIVPRDYGISLVTEDNTSLGKANGYIGNEEPMQINYLLTVSGTTMPNTITAQVIGDYTTIDGLNYCLFRSADNSIKVPISAYLNFLDSSGNYVDERNSCNDSAISLKDALWQQTPWDENSNDEGYFFTTNLNLKFPLDESVSNFTVDGKDWEGVVNATGEIQVIANWIGVEQ